MAVVWGCLVEKKQNVEHQNREWVGCMSKKMKVKALNGQCPSNIPGELPHIQPQTGETAFFGLPDVQPHDFTLYGADLPSQMIRSTGI